MKQLSLHAKLALLACFSACAVPVLAATELTFEQKATASSATLTSIREAPALQLVETDFAITPPRPGWELGTVSSLAFDKDGLLYLLQRGEKADPVLVVDKDGKVIRSWGKGMFRIPHYIRIDTEGNVWTTDAQSSVIYKFSPQGEKLLEISVGEKPAGKNGFVGTTDIAFGPGGRLFVSDGYANARIIEYAADGRRVREWGTAGTGPGELNLPHAIVCDGNGILYVADRENGRIQRLDLEGKYLGQWAIGKTYSLKLSGGVLWAGFHAVDQPTGSPGWLAKIDPRTGAILGTVAVPEKFGMHAVEVDANGQPVTVAKNRILWFRNR
jgi:DNA-binding beta-propeller fold protein YncE